MGMTPPDPSPAHFTAVMADRKEQTKASWEDMQLPDQFPEPHTEGGRERLQGRVGGAAESDGDHLRHPSPNLLLMLKAAQSWRTPQGRGETAGPQPVGEAQRTDMVSGGANARKRAAQRRA